MKLRFLAAPVLAAGLVLGSTGAAFAADSTSTPPAKSQLSDSQNARLQKACGRIPELISRVEKLQQRLPADANTKGSIAWVQAKADKAQANGHADLASVLRDRVTTMTARESILQTRLTALQDAQSICSSHGA